MRSLNIHYFQQVAFEGLGSIEEWALQSGHSLTSTRFYENAMLPEIADIDWLIIMGGPMSVHEEEKYPWLTIEKQFIRKAIDEGKIVLGICLGSQLIAEVLGARVYPNDEKEIGWFDVDLTDNAIQKELFHEMERRMKVFQWHGDTFGLPEYTVHLASSTACRNQAFLFNEKVLALQFHLEITPSLLQYMIENGREELTGGKYMQTETEIMNSNFLPESNRRTLFSILDWLAAK